MPLDICFHFEFMWFFLALQLVLLILTSVASYGFKHTQSFGIYGENRDNIHKIGT